VGLVITAVFTPSQRVGVVIRHWEG
jgi:hypothetical protein